MLPAGGEQLQIWSLSFPKYHTTRAKHSLESLQRNFRVGCFLVWYCQCLSVVTVRVKVYILLSYILTSVFHWAYNHILVFQWSVLQPSIRSGPPWSVQLSTLSFPSWSIELPIVSVVILVIQPFFWLPISFGMCCDLFSCQSCLCDFFISWTANPTGVLVFQWSASTRLSDLD